MSLLAVELEARNWVLVGRFESRVDAKENTDAKANDASGAKDLPGDMWSEWCDEGDEEGEDVAKDEAHEAANYA